MREMRSSWSTNVNLIFEQGDNNYYGKITLGNSTQETVAWCEFALPEGFLVESEENAEPLFVRYEETLLAGSDWYRLSRGINGLGSIDFTGENFEIYNKTNG